MRPPRYVIFLFWIAYFLLIIWCSLNLYAGRSGLLTTLTVYITLIIVSFKSLGAICKNKYRAGNLKLFFGFLFVSLFIVELLLKYAFQTWLSYPEKNGNYYYQSQYRQYILENKVKKVQNKKNCWLKINPPNTSKLISKPEFEYTHSYNSYGLRNAEISSNGTSDYLIIGLGDSFTEGTGAPQDSTWLFLLENSLDRSKETTIINGGVRGSDIFYEYMLLVELLRSYKPDLVILAINSSDINDIIVRGGNERFMIDSTVKYNDPPWWEPLYSFSFIFRNIIHSILDIDWTLLSQSELEKETQKAKQLICESVLTDYQKLAYEKGFRLLVVFHPRIQEIIDRSFPLDDCYVKLKKNNKIEVLSLYEEIIADNSIATNKIKDYFWKIDLHHNSKGYKLMADHIFSYLTHRENVNDTLGIYKITNN